MTIDLIEHDALTVAAESAPAVATAVATSPTGPDPVPVSPLDLPTAVFAAALDRRSANRAALVQWVRSALVDGVDYGRIHSVGKSKCPLAAQGRASECAEPRHWSKPSLFKAGAEKISGMLGVTVHYPTLAEYEQAALHGVDIKTVLLRCELRDASGRVLADGMGARALEQDYGDLNKALKMAAKSAHIDATLRLAGLSEVFTQDLEEMKPRDAALTPPRDARPIGPASAEKRQLEARIQTLSLDRTRVKDWCHRKWGIEHFAELSAEQWRTLLAKLPTFAAAANASVRDTRPLDDAAYVDPYFGGDTAEQMAG